MLEQASAAARLYGLAGDRDQGRLLLDSIRGYQARTPLLHGALVPGAYRVSAPGRDVVLEILAADAPGAWGLRPWLVIVDELAQWPSTPTVRQLWEAVTSAVAKLADARMAVLTSAGDPAHWSAKVLEHALADPLWRVHEVPGPAPWMDEARLEEQRRRLPASSYARLFLNEWTAAEDRLTSLDDLRACVLLDGPLTPQPHERYVVSLDLGLTHDRTVGVVAHAEPHVWLTGFGETDGAEALGPNPGNWYEPDAAKRFAAAQARAEMRSNARSGQRVVLDRIEVWQGSKGGSSVGRRRGVGAAGGGLVPSASRPRPLAGGRAGPAAAPARAHPGRGVHLLERLGRAAGIYAPSPAPKPRPCAARRPGAAGRAGKCPAARDEPGCAADGSRPRPPRRPRRCAGDGGPHAPRAAAAAGLADPARMSRSHADQLVTRRLRAATDRRALAADEPPPRRAAANTGSADAEGRWASGSRLEPEDASTNTSAFSRPSRGPFRSRAANNGATSCAPVVRTAARCVARQLTVWTGTS
jgi:hypothetical protein